MKQYYISPLGLSVLLSLFPTGKKESCTQGYSVANAPVKEGFTPLLIKYPADFETAGYDAFVFWVTPATDEHPYRKFQVHGLKTEDRNKPLAVRTLFLDLKYDNAFLKWGKGQCQVSVFKFYLENIAYLPEHLEAIENKAFSIEGNKRTNP